MSFQTFLSGEGGSKDRNIYVILVSFKHVSCNLVLVVCVIHILRNFLFKNQSIHRQGISQAFLGILLRVQSVPNLLYKRQRSESTSSCNLQSNQVKKLSRFSQTLFVYYWHFKLKVISFLSLHKARRIYKTVSCLFPSRSFSAQSQIHNVRETFRTFFSSCCVTLERVND